MSTPSQRFNGRLYTQKELDEARATAALSGELKALRRMKEWRKANNPRIWNELPEGASGTLQPVYLDDRIESLEEKLKEAI